MRTVEQGAAGMNGDDSEGAVRSAPATNWLAFWSLLFAFVLCFAGCAALFLTIYTRAGKESGAGSDTTTNGSGTHVYYYLQAPPGSPK